MAETNVNHPKVIIFTTPTCTFCNMTKKYLRDKGIRFKEVDVSRDPAAARDMVKRSGQMGCQYWISAEKLWLGLTDLK